MPKIFGEKGASVWKEEKESVIGGDGSLPAVT